MSLAERVSRLRSSAVVPATDATRLRASPQMREDMRQMCELYALQGWSEADLFALQREYADEIQKPGAYDLVSKHVASVAEYARKEIPAFHARVRLQANQMRLEESKT